MLYLGIIYPNYIREIHLATINLPKCIVWELPPDQTPGTSGPKVSALAGPQKVIPHRTGKMVLPEGDVLLVNYRIFVTGHTFYSSKE
jgi:hypothetical protein